MPIKHLNPTDLMKPLGYSHAVITTGGKTIYIAGQGAFNKNWQLVGEGDHRAQAEQACMNLVTVLEAAGATLSDVVKSTMYIVGLNDQSLKEFGRGVSDALGEQGMPPTASTMVGVECLALPGMLIEIDAIAVVDE